MCRRCSLSERSVQSGACLWPPYRAKKILQSQRKHAKWSKLVTMLNRVQLIKLKNSNNGRCSGKYLDFDFFCAFLCSLWYTFFLLMPTSYKIVNDVKWAKKRYGKWLTYAVRCCAVCNACVAIRQNGSIRIGLFTEHLCGWSFVNSLVFWRKYIYYLSCI